MPDFLPPYIIYLLTAALGCIISIYGVRKTIFIARSRNLYDKPDDIRKIHGKEIPSMGGIGIFVGYVIASAVYWYWCGIFLPFLMASSAMLLFTGIYDDIMNMRPVKKLLAQLVASGVTLAAIWWQFGSGMCDSDAYFMLRPEGLIVLTLCCTFFINVFNFIDGIDGLACSLGMLYLTTIGVLLCYFGAYGVAGLAFTLAGATAGLLVFNKAPARIYMGDTGSMFIGFSVFVLSTIFLFRLFKGSLSELDMKVIMRYTPMWSTGDSRPGWPTTLYGQWLVVNTMIAMPFMPIFDALRVFALRMSRGTSPLKADRTHLHYYLLDAGCTHTQAVGVIVGTNVLCMAAAFVMQDLHPVAVIGVCVAINAAVLLVVLRARGKRA